MVEYLRKRSVIGLNNREMESRLYRLAKTMATVLVVIGHATIMYTASGAYHPKRSSVLLGAVAQLLYQFHMPLFIFLSGTVYGICLEKGKYQNRWKFLQNKGRRLLIPYVVFGLFYVAPSMCLLGLTDQDYLRYCLSGILLSGNSRHLWYLMALMWTFAASLLFRPLVGRTIWKNLLALAIGVGLYMLREPLPTVIQFQAGCQYLIFFLAGWVFHFYYSQFSALVEKTRGFCFLLPLGLLCSFWFNPNQWTDLAYRFLGIAATLACAMDLLRRFDLLGRPWFRTLEENAFGIYLFHPMILYVVFHFLGQSDLPAVVLCAGALVVAMLLSIAATKLLRCLHLQFLMGE